MSTGAQGARARRGTVSRLRFLLSGPPRKKPTRSRLALTPMKKFASALDRPLPTRGKNEVALSAFAFLFSEFIQYSQQRVEKADELERKLEEAGIGIGQRILELGCLREKSSRRETRVLGILQFITGPIWKMLFGSAAKDSVSLEKSVEQDDEFMIVEKQPIVTTYISNSPCSCAAFVAGIVRGVLESAQFSARVTAHEEEERTVILIKFSREVMDREYRIS